MTKILLLSNSQSMLNSLSERLRFENFATAEAPNINTATEMCRNDHYDVAIVDGDGKFDNIGDLALPTIIIVRKAE